MKAKSAAMREHIFIPEHRTRILPLRYLANYVFHPISMFFFRIGLRYNDKIEWDRDYKWDNRFMEAFGFKLYKLFNYPYDWWGTIYKIDMDKWKENLGEMATDLAGPEWNDYDENGIPYWYYLWHEDPITGDAWRLVSK